MGLSLAEVTKSNTAKRLGIDNTPDDWAKDNLRKIAEHVFQPLRTLSSVLYTCRAAIVRLSSMLLSVVRSAVSMWKEEHLIWTQTYSDAVQTVKSSAGYSTTLTFDQLIWEFGDNDNPDWVHVSFVYDGINRGRCLKACRDDEGKTYYEVIFGKGL